jgi:hypothetical protein
MAGGAALASMGGVASVSGAIVIGRTGSGDGATGASATGTVARTCSFPHPAALNDRAQAKIITGIRSEERWLGIYRFSAAKGTL